MALALFRLALTFCLVACLAAAAAYGAAANESAATAAYVLIVALCAIGAAEIRADGEDTGFRRMREAGLPASLKMLRYALCGCIVVCFAFTAAFGAPDGESAATLGYAMIAALVVVSAIEIRVDVK